jgi:hypothetical protein
VHQKHSEDRNSVRNPATTLPDLADVAEVVDLDNFIPKRKSSVNGLIILQPKNTLVFPLAENSRFPVSVDDIMHYSTIVELAYTDRIQKYVFTFFFGFYTFVFAYDFSLSPFYKWFTCFFNAGTMPSYTMEFTVAMYLLDRR